jgi:hypothetical protein
LCWRKSRWPTSIRTTSLTTCSCGGSAVSCCGCCCGCCALLGCGQPGKKERQSPPPQIC